ncbi:MAG: acetylxylan esterase [Caldilineaceae bacterium]
MSIQITPAPADLHQFWSATMDELAQLPAAPELPEIALRSTDFGAVYGLRLTSLDAYRIFAYYCVPHGEGPFPVLFHAPGYGSVVHVPPYEERQQYVVVSLCHRGQRLADQPFAAAYPGLLTTGIEDAQNYVYRGIMADCCRVIDFLLTRDEVDASRIAVMGNDLALFTAALRPQVSALYYTPGFFYAAQASTPQTSAYPSEEINEYVRTHPDAAARVWRTLSYYEPTHLAPHVGAQTLLVTGDDPAATAPMEQALGGPVETYATAHSAYRDGVQQARWLANWSGIGEPVLPEHWR